MGRRACAYSRGNRLPPSRSRRRTAHARSDARNRIFEPPPSFAWRALRDAPDRTARVVGRQHDESARLRPHTLGLAEHALRAVDSLRTGESHREFRRTRPRRPFRRVRRDSGDDRRSYRRRIGGRDRRVGEAIANDLFRTGRRPPTPEPERDPAGRHRQARTGANVHLPYRRNSAQSDANDAVHRSGKRQSDCRPRRARVSIASTAMSPR